jgi:hypothetical protein
MRTVVARKSEIAVCGGFWLTSKTRGMTLFYSDSMISQQCSQIIDTPMTVYRPVWKTLLTTIDGTATTTVTLDKSQTDNGNTTVLEHATRVEGGVYIFWREMDLVSFPESYASVLAKKFDIDYTPSGASTTAASRVVSETAAAQSRTSSSLASPTSSSTSDSTSTSSGLSLGAKAGIGIGLVLLFLLAALGILFLIKRRRKMKAHNAAELYAEEQKMMPELSGRDQPQCVGVVEEAACKGVVMVAHELDGKMRSAELDGRGTGEVHELDVERR